MLGRDRNGKPLYPGDVVLFFAPTNAAAWCKEYDGRQMTVLGPADPLFVNFARALGHTGTWVEVEKPGMAAKTCFLVKIRDWERPEASWDEIEYMTDGWRPPVPEDQKEVA